MGHCGIAAQTETMIETGKNHSEACSGNAASHRRNLEVVMVVSAFPSVSQTFVALQIAGLCQAGYAVKIVRMGARGDKRWIAEDLRPIFDKLVLLSLPYNDTLNVIRRFLSFLPVCAANTWRHPVASLRVFLDKAMRLKLAEFVRIHNDAYLFEQVGDADIIHFQFVPLAHRYSQMKRYGFIRPKAGIACSVRGYDISRKTVVDEMDWSAIVKDVSLFLPVCDFIRRILEGRGVEKAIRVVRSPVDVEKLASLRKQRAAGTEINIISVGRLIEKKGFDDALKALAAVKQAHANIQYTIVGDGPLRPMLSFRIHEYGLTGRVDLKGALPSDETLKRMAEADILIAPSRTASDGEVEGIPNVLKEAMCLGLQVIATRHAGISELVEDGVNGILVSENAPEEIAKALDELIQNRDQWAMRSERAILKVSEEYDPGRTTWDLMDAYEWLLNESKTKQ